MAASADSGRNDTGHPRRNRLLLLIIPPFDRFAARKPDPLVVHHSFAKPQTLDDVFVFCHGRLNFETRIIEVEGNLEIASIDGGGGAGGFLRAFHQKLPSFRAKRREGRTRIKHGGDPMMATPPIIRVIGDSSKQSP